MKSTTFPKYSYVRLKAGIPLLTWFVLIVGDTTSGLADVNPDRPGAVFEVASDLRLSPLRAELAVTSLGQIDPALPADDDHRGTPLKWVRVAEKLGSDAARVIIKQTGTDLGGNTSVRNALPLTWKESGYFQRARDLGQVFTAPEDFTLDAIVLRTGNDRLAFLPGAAGAEVFIQFFEVNGTPVINVNGTPPGTKATHGFSTNHRCDDFVTGVSYEPLRVVRGGRLPDLAANGDGRLTYMKWAFSESNALVFHRGKRYAFMVGLVEPGADRNFTLANRNNASSPQPPALTDSLDAYGGGWGLRREGNGQSPPTMFPGPQPPTDPAQCRQLETESTFPKGEARFAISPTCDGYPDVDTYRDLEFYLVGAPFAGPLPSLNVSDNHRFLTTADGKPFFWVGDTAWELFHRLDRTEAEHYLRDRAAKGFTVIQAVALAELDGLTEPNRHGHVPLLEQDPARPAERDGPANDYWDFVDDIIDLAAAERLYVGFLPTWGKYVTSSAFDGKVDGVFNVINAHAYGRFLGARYFDRSNVIWILGGDKAPSTPEAVAIWRAMARGIAEGVSGREDYSKVLMTYHTSGPGHVSDYLHGETWLDFTSAQSSHGDLVESWRFIERHWNRMPIMPVLDLESSYPDALIPAAWLPVSLRAAHSSTKPSNDDHARRAAYWAVFAGAAGHTYGHNSIWQMYAPPRKPILNPRTTWREALDAPSARQMGYLRALIESRPFLTQRPDQALFAEDPGAGADHCRALRGDGYALLYTPTGRTLDVSLGRILAAQVSAAWFNPRTGETTALGDVENQGCRAFDPPGEPAPGNDWVLVLQSQR